jgi:hypothetical protein
MPNIVEATQTVWRPWYRLNPALGDSWQPWRVFLKAVFGLAMSEPELAIYQAHTGRTEGRPGGFREVWCRVGRRSGKSLTAATMATFLACFVDWSDYMVPGEAATVMVLASDRRQARVIFNYIRRMLTDVPILARMVKRELEESIELSNGLTLEIATASYRRVRGYSVIAAVCDEIAYWMSDESANPDREVLNALRPAMGSIPEARLFCLSSPYARSGALYEADRDNWGRDDSDVLIWRGTTMEMNPTYSQAVIDKELERDPSAAAAEYLAEYRSDVETWLSREVVDACTVPGRHELAPDSSRHRYRATVDPSGGSSDSMTLCIAHMESAGAGLSASVGVIDLIREVRPPFSPDSTVRDFTAILKQYRCSSVTGDRYAGEWVRERFRLEGIGYEVSEKTASDYYNEALPLFMARRVELVEHTRLQLQLAHLERRVARQGRLTVSHRPGGHDDVANAACMALVIVAGQPDPISIWIMAGGGDPATAQRGKPFDPRQQLLGGINTHFRSPF